MRIWFQAFWWTVGFVILAVVGAVTAFLGVGFILLGIACLGGFILYLWFTVVSFFGLLKLIDNRPR